MNTGMRFIPELFLFLLGLGIGSFLNVLLLRFNTGESFITGRSRCFSCGRKLYWFELIPVFSFIFQRARCRTCQSKISWQYPLVELASGSLFLVFFLKWQNEFGNFSEIGVLFWWLLTGFLLLFLSAYDLKHKVLPDAFSYILIVFALLGNIIFLKSGFYPMLLSMIPALLIFLLWFFSGGKAMGLGDAKLMLAGGFFLGWPGAVIALVSAFWAGAVVGVILILSKRSYTIKSEIAFGPYLSLGILMAFLFPEVFLNYFYLI